MDEHSKPTECPRVILISRYLKSKNVIIKHILVGGEIQTQEEFENSLVKKWEVKIKEQYNSDIMKKYKQVSNTTELAYKLQSSRINMRKKYY